MGKEEKKKNGKIKASKKGKNLNVPPGKEKRDE